MKVWSSGLVRSACWMLSMISTSSTPGDVLFLPTPLSRAIILNAWITDFESTDSNMI